MPPEIDELLSNPDVRRTDPPPPELIEEVEAWYGVPLPDDLVRLWGYSNGFGLDMIDADILGPSEVLRFSGSPIGEWMVDRGFLPLVYDRQSSYLGLMVQEPLTPRVAYLPHDDGIPTLRYRDMTRCLRALLDAGASGKAASTLLAETLGDYPSEPNRPVEDQIAARELLATSGLREEWYYAVQLLDETNFAAWERLLETEKNLRARVRARMSTMQSAEIEEMLRADAEALAAFTSDSADAIRKAGMVIDEQTESTIRMGEQSFDLEFFFYRRHTGEAIPRLVLWIADLATGRNPYDRPGHFMAD